MSERGSRPGGHRLKASFPGTAPFDLNLSVLTATLSGDPREGRGPNGDPVTLLWVEYPVADPAHPQTLWTWASCLVEVSGEDAREQARDLRGGEAVLASGQLSSRWVTEDGHMGRRGVVLATLVKSGPFPSQLELPA
jgi:primosomal replication protein N